MRILDVFFATLTIVIEYLRESRCNASTSIKTCRAYNIFNMAYPAVWTVLNDGTFGEVFMFPIPTQANPIDASVSCLPSSLNSDNDFDAIPDTFADSVKFGAAALAFMSTYRWASADTMIAQGGGYVLPQRASADRGKTRSYYPSFP